MAKGFSKLAHPYLQRAVVSARRVQLSSCQCNGVADHVLIRNSQTTSLGIIDCPVSRWSM